MLHIHKYSRTHAHINRIILMAIFQVQKGVRLPLNRYWADFTGQMLFLMLNLHYQCSEAVAIMKQIWFWIEERQSSLPPQTAVLANSEGISCENGDNTRKRLLGGWVQRHTCRSIICIQSAARSISQEEEYFEMVDCANLTLNVMRPKVGLGSDFVTAQQMHQVSAKFDKNVDGHKYEQIYGAV